MPVLRRLLLNILSCIFLVSQRKHILWILIKSASFRHFSWVPQYVFLLRIRTIFIWIFFIFWPALVAQLDVLPTGDQAVVGLIPAGLATFLHEDWSWNIFYGHFLPLADSRRAVVSFWRKNVHNTGQLLRGLSLPSRSVVRLTYCAWLDPIGLTGL